MIIKTILIFLIALLGYSEWLTGTSYLQRPIVLGPLVGLVMGDMVTGTIMGATMELAMVGAISVGAYNPPDTTKTSRTETPRPSRATCSSPVTRRAGAAC